MFFDINLDDYNGEENKNIKNSEYDDINESIEDNINNDLCQDNSSDNDIKKDENFDKINELKIDEFYPKPLYKYNKKKQKENLY